MMTMILNFLKKSALALLAFAFCFLLMTAIPLFNAVVKGGLFRKQEKTVNLAAVQVKNINPQTMKPKENRVRSQPERKKANVKQAPTSPRFAMDLGVMGVGGASLKLDHISAKTRGTVAGVNSEGVDEVPRPESNPVFKTPQKIVQQEINASTRLSFCVDATGRVYDIQVLDESPAGLGFAEAVMEGLRSTRMIPAKKGGQAVPFCGMQQPFGVEFRD